MDTVNRGHLRKLAEQGKLVKIESYNFDDQMGGERSHKETPVRICKNYGDWREGQCNLWENDFKTKSGTAWKNPDGTITLIVHSNCNYTFRVSHNSPTPH